MQSVPRTIGLYFTTVFTGLFLAQAASTGEIQGWRGDGSGDLPDAKIVTSWSETENVLWKSPLPNWGNGQPVVAGDLAIVICEPLDTAPLLCCFDANSGKVRWQVAIDHLEPADKAQFQEVISWKKEVNRKQIDLHQAVKDKNQETIDQILAWATAEGITIKKDKKAKNPQIHFKGLGKKGGAMGQLKKVGAVFKSWAGCWEGLTFPAPLCDGNRVWTWTAPGIAACFDKDGQQLWLRYISPYTDQWDKPRLYPGTNYVSAPCIANGVMIVSGSDRIHGLDAKSGDILWSRQAANKQGWEPNPMLRIQLGDATGVLAHDGVIYRPCDGRPLWTSGMDPAHGGLMIKGDIIGLTQAANNSMRNATTVIWRLSVKDADQWQAEELWRGKEKQQVHLSRDHNCSAPVAYDQHIFCNNHIIDLHTGETLCTPTKGRTSSKNPASVHLNGNHSSPWRVGPHLLIGSALFRRNEWEQEHGGRLAARFQVVDAKTMKVIAVNYLHYDKSTGDKLAQRQAHSKHPGTWDTNGLSTPFISNNRIYIRTHDNLYCIGSQ